MSNVIRKAELLANAAIIIVAVLLGAVLINIGLGHAPSKSVIAERPRIAAGTKLSLLGLDWAQGDHTLLMVLSTNCRFCTESAPFYKRLAQEKARRANIRLVAVLPQALGEAQKYLIDHGISVDEVRQSTPRAEYAKATPTLILVDRTGTVVESWAGKLPPQKEAEVLDRFLNQSDD